MRNFNTKNDHGQRVWTHPGGLEFSMGGSIAPLELVFETWGELNAAKDNVIIIHHALSPSCHIASSPQHPEPGWWEAMVGPGKPIDSDRYFIICINNIGSYFGSSSPISINPVSGKAYQADFPTITMSDIVNSQRLLLQAMGIEQVHAMIGNSMGAMISLQWAIDYPNDLRNLISISSCYKAYPANIANRVVQREIIQLDPDWHGGYYTTPPPCAGLLSRAN